MRSLTDIHHQLSAVDQVYLEKEAEAIKIAEEEDAAGRIMARGFADELAKLAEVPFGSQRTGSPGAPETIKTKPGFQMPAGVSRGAARGAAAAEGVFARGARQQGGRPAFKGPGQSSNIQMPGTRRGGASGQMMANEQSGRVTRSTFDPYGK